MSAAEGAALEGLDAAEGAAREQTAEGAVREGTAEAADLEVVAEGATGGEAAEEAARAEAAERAARRGAAADVDQAWSLERAKQAKSRAKAALTRARRRLLVLVDRVDRDRTGVELSDVHEALDVLDDKFDDCFGVVTHLFDVLDRLGDIEGCRKVNEELEAIDEIYQEARAHATSALVSPPVSSLMTPHQTTVTHPEFESPPRQVRRPTRPTPATLQPQLTPQPDPTPQPTLAPQAQEARRPSASDAYGDEERQGEVGPTPSAAGHHEQPRSSGPQLAEEEGVLERIPPPTASEHGDNVSGRPGGYREDAAQNTVQSGLADPSGVPMRPPHTELGHDMWKQLKRVSIPIFGGDKRVYESWKATFLACVDSAPATAEYKLLQLRQYLQGEALRSIEDLGHTATAYEAAKARLDRKYGGQRRQIALQMEEIDLFEPIRPGRAKDVERLADLVDTLVVKLKDTRRVEELGCGSLYSKLCRKMNESLLTQYHRWVFEQHREESVETLLAWLNREAEFQTVAAETMGGVTSAAKSRPERPPRRALHSARMNTSGCKVCNKQHGVWMCPTFAGWNVSQRWELAKRSQLCFRCLSDRHRGSSCPRSRTCGINGCRRNHHRLLHREQPSEQHYEQESQATGGTGAPATAQPGRTTQQSSAISPVYGSHTEGGSHVNLASQQANMERISALRTIPVYVRNGNKRMEVIALLDDGSTETYLNSSVAAELGLKGESTTITVQVFNGQMETFTTTPVSFEVASKDGRYRTAISAATADRVTGNLVAFNWNSQVGQWKHLQGISFPAASSRSSVDLLIGLDNADLHRSLEEVSGEPGEPIARRTPLGWTCVGTPRVQHSAVRRQTHFVRAAPNKTDQAADAVLRHLWDIESMPEKSDVRPFSLDERQAIQQAESSLCYVEGRYQIGLPWKSVSHTMPSSYDMARRRLLSTERRLLNDPFVAEEYARVITEYLSQGYIRKLGRHNELGPGWYLPHFAVTRQDATTTKVRVVFDASASCHGVSLNDMVLPGPKLQQDLTAVLLRFRRNPVALVCDIAQMYLQIRLSPEDRAYHRFLWRDLNCAIEPEVYEFTRVAFGVNAAPFLAQYVSQQHAQSHSEEYPMAAETVLKSTYMDDSMDSARDDGQGVQLYQQLSRLWQGAGMHARKWLSNSPGVLAAIPQADLAQQLNITTDPLPATKTLGVLWLSSEDVFTFRVRPTTAEAPLTKRAFLKLIATLFDPLGFITPFTIGGRTLLQEMWVAGAEWDDVLPEPLLNRVSRWFSNLAALARIKVSRCLRLGQESTVIAAQLHVFVDASEEAYGAVVYQRSEYVDGKVTCRLVLSKARVAPLSATSVPRLELMGAVVGCRLAESSAEVLELPCESTIIWSDSMTVLCWIRTKSRRFKPFVGNRVGEIQAATEPSQWRHVPTAENPADLVTRPMSAAELEGSGLWWNGPAFLVQDETSWPQPKLLSVPATDSELRSTTSAQKPSQRSSATEGGTFHAVVLPWNLQAERFRSWTHLRRIYAWVTRFVDNCRLMPAVRVVGELSAEELQDAETELIRAAQQEFFRTEIQAIRQGTALSLSSKIAGLNPVLDEDGVLRAKGRLEFAEDVPLETRRPVILPRRAWVTRLIVRDVHRSGHHALGVNHTLSLLSKKYWIVAAREVIRTEEKECATCCRRRAKPGTQIMAPLPANRTEVPPRPFHKVGVDYAGPFNTVQGRGRQRRKRYLCLFVCLSTRAVHLEIAFSLDTDAFLNAFYRMASRRGLPVEVISDNGTNFVGANNELGRLVRALDQAQIQRSAANKGVRWSFNPPYGPHFGGSHESMVKSAKRAIFAILSGADVTDEELLTAMVGAEGLINSRPLTYVTSDHRDTALTPNHFLLGEAGAHFAPESVDSTPFSLRKRWRYIQQLMLHFWRRWMREWLPTLSPRSKWRREQRDLRVNDVVIVVSPDTPRGQWPIGRIIETFPGRDGHVRVVKLRVGGSTILRPATRVCLLHIE